MSAGDLNRALTDVDGRFLDEALTRLEEYEKTEKSGKRMKPEGKRAVILRIAAVAAAVLLLVGAVLGVSALIGDQREYKEALAFFESKELSAAGLSRGEIKAVYKDIDSGAFILTKTREVIMRSVDPSEAFGENLELSELTSDQLRSLWSYIENRRLWQGNGDVIWSAENDYDRKCCVVTKAKDGEQVFSTEIPDMNVTGFTPLADGAAVYGTRFDGNAARVAKVSDGGSLLWSDLRSRYKMKFEFFRGAFGLENGDVVFIGYGRRADVEKLENTLSFSVYTANGIEKTFVESKLPGPSAAVTNVVAFGDGYLAALRRSPERGMDSFVQIGEDGEVREMDFYQDARNNYLVKDVKEVCGRVFVSLTALPKSYVSSGRVDLSDALDVYLSEIRAQGRENDEEANGSAALAQALSDRVGARLLIWDPVSGELKEFFAADRAIAGEVEEKDGRIVWTVCRPTGVERKEDGIELYGTSLAERIVFDDQGVFLSIESTQDYLPIDWN